MLLILNTPQLAYAAAVLAEGSACALTLTIWVLLSLLRLAGEIVCSWAAVWNSSNPGASALARWLSRQRSVVDTFAKGLLFVGTIWVFSSNSCSPAFFRLCLLLLCVQYGASYPGRHSVRLRVIPLPLPVQLWCSSLASSCLFACQHTCFVPRCYVGRTPCKSERTCCRHCDVCGHLRLCAAVYLTRSALLFAAFSLYPQKRTRLVA